VEWVCWARGDQSEQSLLNHVCNMPEISREAGLFV